MSLINEALKKAQRHRMDESAAAAPPAAVSDSASQPRIVKRRTPMPARTQIILLIGGSAVLLMACVLGFLFLLPDSPDSPPPKPRAVVQSPVTPVVQPDPEPVPPPAPPAPPAPVPVTIELPEIEPVKAPPAAPLVPTANPKVYEFLETLRVSGIRVSATDPKVIMNDRVFRINDLVDRNTQLRLFQVDASTLTFVDANGFKYQKSF